MSLTAGEQVLDLRLDSTDPQRLEDVVGRHLVRFGIKDELIVNWVRDDGTPGTTQREDGTEQPRP